MILKFLAYDCLSYNENLLFGWLILNYSVLYEFGFCLKTVKWQNISVKCPNSPISNYSVYDKFKVLLSFLFQTIQFTIITHFNSIEKTILFQAIQLSMSTLFGSILAIDIILSAAASTG